MNILLLGPPGSGKGTQAKRIQEQFGVEYLSTGGIFQAQAAAGNKAVADLLATGKLFPDEMVNDTVRNFILGNDLESGFLLDGYPRTLSQAKEFDSYASLDHVLYFNVPDEVIISRIEGRLVCSGCPEIYHRETRPPLVDNTCDSCESTLKTRVDDTDKIHTRLEEYHTQTEPLVAHYAQVLRPLRGRSDPDTVWKNIYSILQ